MTYDELRARLLSLPGATQDWLTYTLSYSDDGRPIPTSYCLVKHDDEDWAVFQGDERGGTFPATREDGETPLTFRSESSACEWIWQEILWWREFEERRAAR
ncbi:hypothetical protein PU630_01650 [Microbacterium horticulturae]|uniref:Immunity protein 53 n=1 Tax=Microbacterium horticulturae TaxID=3028316 RepID=A0ABY8BYP3_9MICO|nr:hypothetical protein [Microbacterium sp. KACC 23027]WEG09293.1 hypothetical protein PU630_01650 [Microbacterium sp. KACC 23027]